MNKSNIIVGLFMTLIIFYSFLFIQETNKIAIETLSIFIKSIFPALFPFIILNYLLIRLGIFEIVSYLIQFITYPLFNISGHGGSIFLIGLISGYPSSAIFTSLLIKNKKINKKEGQRLVNAVFFPSFSFLFVILKSNLNSNLLFSQIAISLYLASLILLYLTGLKKEDIKLISFKEAKKSFFETLKNFNLLLDLKDGIYYAFINLLNIAGIMVIFSIPYSLFNHLLNQDYSLYLSGLFEFSFPTIKIANLLINEKHKLVLISFILGWGGLSAIMQSSLSIKESNLELLSFIKARILIALLSTILILIMLV